MSPDMQGYFVRNDKNKGNVMTKQRKKRLLFWSLAAVLLAAVVIWIAWGNTALELNTFTVSNGKIPQSFNGFRIAHVSDLHNKEIGKDNESLLEMLKQAAPDIIVITGDLIDSRRTDLEIALDFAEEAVKIAPCYYVTGNHEARLEKCEELKASLRELGVVVLEDEQVVLTRDGEQITLFGIDDPSFETEYLLGHADEVVDSKLAGFSIEGGSYTVLLSHRPELFEVYADHEVNLVLSGHAHGGQFRLPFVGGLFAPNQGFFPKYDAGLFSEGDTNMIVSRGLKSGGLLFRLNNRPELVLIELKGIE